MFRCQNSYVGGYDLSTVRVVLFNMYNTYIIIKGSPVYTSKNIIIKLSGRQTILPSQPPAISKSNFLKGNTSPETGYVETWSRSNHIFQDFSGDSIGNRKYRLVVLRTVELIIHHLQLQSPH